MSDLDEKVAESKVKATKEIIEIIQPYKLFVPEEGGEDEEDPSKNPFMNRVTIKNINEFFKESIPI